MKKLYILIIFAFAFGTIISISGVASAQGTTRVAATNKKSDVALVLPSRAVQVADNVFSLGSATDPASGKEVHGYAIVHPSTNNKKPSGTPGGGGGTTSSSCYGFLAKGARWKSVEPWVIDTTNDEGLSGASVFSIMQGSIAKWEDAADGKIGNGVSMNILGDGSVGDGFAEAGVMDGVNGVRFGPLDQGTIGVTVVWGIFSGAPQNRELVEWDQVYNTFYTWDTNNSLTDMDFESIATHEIGHSFGMADLYQSECSEETMYGYGSEGETKARDLHAGDVAGISLLY